MKKISLILTLILVLSLLAGCAGTTVVYQTNCTCPTGSHDVAVQETPATEAPVVEAPAAEGAVKTGLAVIASIKITDPTEEAEGKASYDVTYAAVNVDDNGVITACKFDSVGVDVAFDATGAIKTEDSEVLTKHEKGFDYGMVAYGGSTYEWFEQANSVAAYAVGKTVEELKSGAIDESGYAVDVDLKSSASINLFGYIAAIEAAVNNAKHLGAQAGDELKLASVNALSGGNLNGDVVAVTMKDGVITSCYIDAVQAKVAFDATGAITTDLSAAVKTKNELGSDYGMVAIAYAVAEWDAQAASFAAYVTGKTPAEVAGMALNEKTAPADADLATSVTISVIGFQNLIAKAAQ